MRKEERGSSKQMVLEEASNSKSIPAGAKTSNEIASKTPKPVMKDGAKSVDEHGPQPNKEQEQSNNYTIDVTKVGTTQEQEVPRRSLLIPPFQFGPSLSMVLSFDQCVP